MRSLYGKVRRLLTRRKGHRSGPPPERGAAYYDKLFATDAVYRGHYTGSQYYFLWSVIADRLRRCRCRRVLEIGCGPGQLASLLLDLGLVDEYTGLDVSSEAIALAKRNARGRFEVGDALTTELHEECDHDITLCTEVLEHIDFDLEVVRRFKAGVRSICTVPSFPYESHVRQFASAEEVACRYGRYFDDFDVAWYRSPRNPSDLFFLFEGVRREAAPVGEANPMRAAGEA